MVCVLATLIVAAIPPAGVAAPPVVSSAKSGPWSAAATWAGGKVPAAGDKVLVRTGHAVTYDLKSDAVIRSVHVSGTLTFDPDRDTVLNAGLVKIQPGDLTDENGFDCDAHAIKPGTDQPQPALLVGTPDKPVAKTATIRLHYIDGMDKELCPAVVCCGGRMDFHGRPMSRTWVKLGNPAKKGDTAVTLAEAVPAWQAGDRVFLTATTRQMKTKKTFRPTVRDNTQTEERVVTAVAGAKLTLDAPLEFDHTAAGDYRGEVANLSRNVVVESADQAGVRGHTMYHRDSAGGVSYAEFRHLGKRDVLGKYALHFHVCGDTMRGSAVVGASIWDSHNRWLTIHGTNYLVVRDTVGYNCVGHGFFLEDGTEVYNVFDRNLAVQACVGKPLPKQVLPFDHNDGAGYWWANSLNSFTRNVAAECDEYGFRFEAVKNAAFDPMLSVRQPDGLKKATDVRTLPFLRFEDNESHCQRRHAFNLGGLGGPGSTGVGGVGPDAKHPFVIHGFRAWNSHWAFHPLTPSVLVDGMTMHQVEYGLWRADYTGHAYRNVAMTEVSVKDDFAPTKGTRPAEANYPKPLDPVDDLPPVTVVTGVRPAGGKLVVRGTTADNGPVKRVLVNGVAAKSVGTNFAEWEAEVPAAAAVTATAEDAAGNAERTPHTRAVGN